MTNPTRPGRKAPQELFLSLELHPNQGQTDTMMRKLSLLLMTSALISCQSPDHSSTSDKTTIGQAHSESGAQTYIRDTPVEGGLTPERINISPSLSGTRLSSVQIAPSGEFATVLQGREDDAGQQDLWAYDLETGKGHLLVSSTDLLKGPEVLSEEEKNRRERAREYGRGIISYSWINAELLLFPLGGDIYLYDLSSGQSRQVTATKGFETDPKISSDGSKIAYVRDNELFVQDLETGLERQLSEGATETIRNATASFVVQEELARSSGYWMSSNGQKIAYTQIDESPIDIENRIDFGVDGVTNIAQRYPFAGTDNATVKLGFVSTNGGPTKWIALDDDETLGSDIYLTRVAWSVDNKTAFIGVLARDQKTHRIYKVDSNTGEKSVYYEETSSTWLNIRSAMIPTETGGLLWTAERDNFRQIFEIDAQGAIKALTPETLNIRSLACQNGEDFYVTGWKDNPLSTHLFKVNLSKAEDQLVQLTSGEGQHSASFDYDCGRYLDNYSDDLRPASLRAFSADGAPLAWLNENALDEDHPFSPYKDSYIEPEYGQLNAADGTPMDYMLFKPKDLKPGEKRPAITIVYGGPGVQRVRRSFGGKGFANMLAHHGFVVFMMDNRGATNRGKAFEDHLYRKMGQSEVIDQSVGAKWLASQTFVDEKNMGVFGWSYGGYMTLHMLGQTNHYKSGVSGAPVTDWKLYDTAYTERFLGHPIPGDVNYTSGSYEDGSVFKYLDGLTEPVLLIHGMADDNVVFRHSIKLLDAMQKNGQHNLRVMTYPGEKHGFRQTENRTHRDRQILEFFSETLGGGEK